MSIAKVYFAHIGMASQPAPLELIPYAGTK
jgi:hypothetical protein